MQVKLLRVLQERRFRRVGGTRRSRPTSGDRGHQPRLVRPWRGPVREDLFYRINVIPLTLRRCAIARGHPCLRPTSSRSSRADGKKVTACRATRCVPHAVRVPGNIRELENAMERAVAWSRRPRSCGEPPEAVRGAAVPTLRLVPKDAGAPALPVLPERASTSSGTSSRSSATTSRRPRAINGVKMRAAEMLA